MPRIRQRRVKSWNSVAAGWKVQPSSAAIADRISVKAVSVSISSNSGKSGGDARPRAAPSSRWQQSARPVPQDRHAPDWGATRAAGLGQVVVQQSVQFLRACGRRRGEALHHRAAAGAHRADVDRDGRRLIAGPRPRNCPRARSRIASAWRRSMPSRSAARAMSISRKVRPIRSCLPRPRRSWPAWRGAGWRSPRPGRACARDTSGWSSPPG